MSTLKPLEVKPLKGDKRFLGCRAEALTLLLNPINKGILGGDHNSSEFKRLIEELGVVIRRHGYTEPAFLKLVQETWKLDEETG